MIQLSDLEQLRKALLDDSKLASEFPVRFILVENLVDWRILLTVLKPESERHLPLSSLCEDSDTLPDLKSLWTFLNKTIGQRVLVYPLAEHLRLHPTSTDGFFGELAEWRVPAGRSRVYVPLLTAQSIVDHELNNVSRYMAGLLPPIFKLTGSGNVEVEAGPVMRPRPGYLKVTGLKAYFELWENGGAERIALTSNLASYLTGSSGAFEVSILSDAYDVVALTAPHGRLQKSWGGTEEWAWLAGQLFDNESLEQAFKRLLNLQNPDPLRLITFWRPANSGKGQTDKHLSWLSWLWAHFDAPTSGVFALALSTSASVDDLIENLYMLPFYHQINWSAEFANERHAILANAESTPPTRYLAKICEDIPPLDKLRALTGLSKIERENIIKSVGELLRQKVDRKHWWQFLEISYPELAWYLTGFDYSDNLISDYFKFYALARVQDTPTPELAVQAKEAAQRKVLWQLATRAEALAKRNSSNSSVHWSDGLGVEWLGLIEGLVSKNTYISVNFDIARANLPSITGENQGWQNGEIVHRALDQLGHAYDYSFPSSFEVEIQIVKQLVEATIQRLKEGETAFLTSDHGLSRAVFHQNVVPLPKGSTPLKRGRYVTFDQPRDGASAAGEAWVQEGDFWYQALHGRLEGGGSFVGQVHGGATLEECLVPIIRFERVRAKTQIKASLLVSTIRLTPKGIGELSVRLSAHTNVLKLRVEGRVTTGTNQDDNLWSFQLSDMRPGKYVGVLESDFGRITEISFKLTGAIKEDDLGL